MLVHTLALCALVTAVYVPILLALTRGVSPEEIKIGLGLTRR